MPIQKITPFLWFDKEARDAADFYVEVFKGKITKAQQLMLQMKKIVIADLEKASK